MAVVCGAVSALLGLLDVSAWVLGGGRTFTLVPGTPPMMPNTALMTASTGLALALLGTRGPVRRAGPVLAVGTLVVAGLTLADYVPGVRLGVEGLFGLLPDGDVTALAPAPQTGATFLLLSLALLTLDRRPERFLRLSDVLGLFAGAIGAAALLGYLFSTGALYGPTATLAPTGMAVSTALATLLLCAGTLVARPEGGLTPLLASRRAGGVVARRLLLGLVLLVPFAVVVAVGVGVLYDAAFGAALIVFLGLVQGAISVLVTAARLEQADVALHGALAEASRWKRFFEDARFGAVLAAPDGTVCTVNEAFARKVRTSRAALEGTPAATLLASPDAFPALLHEVTTEGRFRGDLTVRRADGTTFPAAVDVTAVHDPDGTVAWLAASVQDITERVAAEEARARLAALVESSDEAILATTPDGVIVAWNAAAERIYGWKAEEVVGRSGLVIPPAERRREQQEVIERVGRGERVPTFETERVRKDGTRFRALLTVSPILDASGRLVGISGMTRDVTAQREAEEALRRTREDLANLVEQASDGIFVADLDGRYTDVNTAGCRMLGYTRDELVGRTIVDLLPPEDADRLWASRERMMEGGVDVAEWRLRRKDGRLVDVEVSAKILPDGRWQGFVRDVSARKEAEAALARTREELATLVDQASDGIFVADRDGRFVSVNAAGSQMLGATADELVGTSIGDAVVPEERHRLGAAIDEQRRGQVHRGEWTALRRDGARLPVEISAKLLTDGRSVALIRDISARRAAEAELERAHEVERQLRDELERVAGAGQLVAEALPEAGVRVVLKTLALQARALTGARYAAVGIGQDAAAPFQPWVAVGMEAEEAAIGRHPRPVGALGIPALQGRVLRVRDVREHPAFGGFPPGHPEMRSLLGVPIAYRGRPVGNLYLADKPGEQGFTADDERVVRMLAARTGAAIETARLYETETLQRTWLESVFAQMPEAVLIVDERGQVVQENVVSEQWRHRDGRVDGWGHPVLHDVRASTGQVLPPDEVPLNRALALGETMVGRELAILTPEGVLVPVLASATPVRTEHGAVGALGVYHDIRTLKELERMREEWTSIVAHDLRQPVAVINMSAEVIGRSCGAEAPAAVAPAVDRIRTAAAMLRRMIGDLLDLSRLEAKRLDLRREQVDVVALVRAQVEALAGITEGHRVDVVAPDEASAWVDPGRFGQILGNLLSNAAKYGDAGTPVGVQVTVEDEHVRVGVSNRGAGIPAEELPLLFQRYVRTRAARGGEREGIGLGLHIAHGLAEAMGGRMWAESRPGDVTRFQFTVPRRPPPVERPGGR